jgi:hypothetical protein
MSFETPEQEGGRLPELRLLVAQSVSLNANTRLYTSELFGVGHDLP